MFLCHTDVAKAAAAQSTSATRKQCLKREPSSDKPVPAELLVFVFKADPSAKPRGGGCSRRDEKPYKTQRVSDEGKEAEKVR